MAIKYYVGKKLREFRKSKKLTLTQMGRIAGVGKVCMQNYETGRLEISIGRLNEICGFFHEDIYYFLPPNNSKRKATQPST